MNKPGGNSNSLAYYIHDGSAAFRFDLAGDLCRHTAQDLEQARQTAASVIGQRSLIVDLTGLTSLDAAGGKLLQEWHALGAQLTVISSEARARIQSMTGVPITLRGRRPGASKWLPSPTAVLWLAALLVLLLLATAIAAASRQAGAEVLAIVTTSASDRRRVRLRDRSNPVRFSITSEAPRLLADQVPRDLTPAAGML